MSEQVTLQSILNHISGVHQMVMLPLLVANESLHIKRALEIAKDSPIFTMPLASLHSAVMQAAESQDIATANAQLQAKLDEANKRIARQAVLAPDNAELQLKLDAANESIANHATLLQIANQKLTDSVMLQPSKEVMDLANTELQWKLDGANERLNAIYNERNTLAIAFARLATMLDWRAGVGRDNKPEKAGWNENWRTVVYVEIPGGPQLSWHMNDDTALSARSLFEYEGHWDGKFTAREAPQWLSYMPGIGTIRSKKSDIHPAIDAVKMAHKIREILAAFNVANGDAAQYEPGQVHSTGHADIEAAEKIVNERVRDMRDSETRTAHRFNSFVGERVATMSAAEYLEFIQPAILRNDELTLKAARRIHDEFKAQADELSKTDVRLVEEWTKGDYITFDTTENVGVGIHVNDSNFEIGIQMIAGAMRSHYKKAGTDPAQFFEFTNEELSYMAESSAILHHLLDYYCDQKPEDHAIRFATASGLERYNYLKQRRAICSIANNNGMSLAEYMASPLAKENGHA